MDLQKINTDQRLYVIAAGEGYSCYGFDVLDRKARAVAQWLGWQGIDRELPTPGTREHFKACDAIMARGAAHAAATKTRCPADLVPALIGREGKRVEATVFGERVRFVVGKSTGWLPVHLMLKSRRSDGGESLIAGHVTDVRVID